MKTEDFEAVNNAIGAIKLIRGHYASGTEGQKRMQEVLTLLRGNRTSLWRVNMADAIEASYGNKELEIVPRKPGSTMIAA